MLTISQNSVDNADKKTADVQSNQLFASSYTRSQHSAATPSAKFFNHLLHILGTLTVADQQRIGR